MASRIRESGVFSAGVVELACRADGRRIDGCGIIGWNGVVAQWIERRFPKPCVGGSSPLSPTKPRQPAPEAKKTP
jgi:hypothetical protein